jgi:alkaline phosphatase D
MKRENNYPLFDITVSPYTSGVSKVSGNELINPNRELNTLVEAQNFGKISFSGNKGERKMNVSFIGIKGEDLANWSINENDLKNK